MDGSSPTVPASGPGVSVAHPPHPELVLLCGGTEQQRAKLRRVHSAVISRTAVTARDVHSLLHWAPRSRAVIVCGELAGIGETTIQRLVRKHAPGVLVIAGDAPPDGRATVGVDRWGPASAPSRTPPAPVAKRRLALA